MDQDVIRVQRQLEEIRQARRLSDVADQWEHAKRTARDAADRLRASGNTDDALQALVTLSDLEGLAFMGGEQGDIELEIAELGAQIARPDIQYFSAMNSARAWQVYGRKDKLATAFDCAERAIAGLPAAHQQEAANQVREARRATGC